jgi:hypothetical protein
MGILSWLSANFQAILRNKFTGRLYKFTGRFIKNTKQKGTKQLITESTVQEIKKIEIGEIFKLALIDLQLRNQLQSKGLELSLETLIQGFIIQNYFITKLGLEKHLSEFTKNIQDKMSEVDNDLRSVQDEQD